MAEPEPCQRQVYGVASICGLARVERCPFVGRQVDEGSYCPKDAAAVARVRESEVWIQRRVEAVAAVHTSRDRRRDVDDVVSGKLPPIVFETSLPYGGRLRFEVTYRLTDEEWQTYMDMLEMLRPAFTEKPR